MRVLYVENSASPMGGSLMSLLQTVKALLAQNESLPADRRFEPFFYFLYPNMLIDEFRALGPVTLERNDFDRYGAPFGLPRAAEGLFKRLPHFIRRGIGEMAPLALRVAHHAKRVKADVVHANCRLGSNEYVVLGARLARVPVVVHERLMYDFSRLTRAVAPAADAVISISNVVTDHLGRQQVPVRKLEVIYDGIDVDELRQAAGSVKEQDAPLRVGMVGRITPWKGQHVFIEAARQLAARDSRIEFHLAGSATDSDAAYLQAVQDMVADAGLEDRVIFHGNVKKIYEFMQKMDIIAHCSVEPEPFGRVILEGMALGKPCIATRGGAAEEICTDGVDGLIVDPDRPDLLADAIHRLSRDPEAAAAIGARARRTVERRFSLATTAQRVRGVYEGVLDRPQRRPAMERATEFLLQNPLSRTRKPQNPLPPG